jgi:hypothetical protein
MKKPLQPLDYLFVLRPVQFYAVWAVFLAGFFVQNRFGVAATHLDVSNTTSASSDGNLLWIGLSLTLLLGAVFVVNQIMSRDAASKDKANLIAQGNITPRVALIEAGILFVAALGAGFFLSPKIGLLMIATAIIGGFLYNFKPFNWKDQPLLSLAANVVGALLIFIAGWVIRGSISTDAVVHSLPYLSMAASIYLLTTVSDSKSKQADAPSSFAEKYGIPTTVYSGLALQVAATILGFVFADELIFYAAFFAVPFSAWAAVKLKTEDVRRAVGYSILLVTIAVLIKYQLFASSYSLFFIMLGFYFFSRFYYRFRFGLDYPRIGA